MRSSRLRTKIKKRILLAVAAAAGVSLIHMIWVRISASGYNLITMDSGAGWHVATMYNASVVLFVVFGGILAAWLCANFIKNRKNSDNLKK